MQSCHRMRLWWQPRPASTLTVALALPVSSPYPTRASSARSPLRPPSSPLLLQKEATGEGQHIELPLYDAMFGAMGAQAVILPEGADDARPHPVVARFYECSDGRWVNINAGYPRALIPMVTAFGHPEWADTLLDIDSLLSHPEDRQLWINTLEDMWRSRPALEWEADHGRSWSALHDVSHGRRVVGVRAV